MSLPHIVKHIVLETIVKQTHFDGFGLVWFGGLFFVNASQEPQY